MTNDAGFALAYAVIMLNTDQHNHNVRKQNIPMTVEVGDLFQEETDFMPFFLYECQLSTQRTSVCVCSPVESPPWMLVTGHTIKNTLLELSTTTNYWCSSLLVSSMHEICLFWGGTEIVFICNLISGKSNRIISSYSRFRIQRTNLSLWLNVWWGQSSAGFLCFSLRVAWCEIPASVQAFTLVQPTAVTSGGPSQSCAHSEGEPGVWPLWLSLSLYLLALCCFFFFSVCLWLTAAED